MRRTRHTLKWRRSGNGSAAAMTAPSDHVSADAVELGALLVLLHGADAPADTVEAIYRLWRHRDRAHAAFLADAEQQKRRGASITLYGPGKAEPEPAEHEETVRIWRAGERSRVEHHGGERDGYYAVADGPLWWMWDERNGAHSNQDDPSVGSGIGEELQIMLNPVPLLSSLRFQPTGSSEIAGRPTISTHGIPRPQDTHHGRAFELHELGTGADFYELEVDRQLGVLLAVTAIRAMQPFHRITSSRPRSISRSQRKHFGLSRRPVNRSNRCGVRSGLSTSRSLRRNNGPRSRC